MKDIKDAEALVVLSSSGYGKIVPNNYWNRELVYGQSRIIYYGSADECGSFVLGYNDPLTIQTRRRKNGKRKQG